VSSDNNVLDTFEDYEDKVKPHLEEEDKQKFDDSYSDMMSKSIDATQRDDYKNLKSLVFDRRSRMMRNDNDPDYQESQRPVQRKSNQRETRGTGQIDTRKSTNHAMRDTGKRSTKDPGRGTNQQSTGAHPKGSSSNTGGVNSGPSHGITSESQERKSSSSVDLL